MERTLSLFLYFCLGFLCILLLGKVFIGVSTSSKIFFFFGVLSSYMVQIHADTKDLQNGPYLVQIRLEHKDLRNGPYLVQIGFFLHFLHLLHYFTFLHFLAFFYLFCIFLYTWSRFMQNPKIYKMVHIWSRFV